MTATCEHVSRCLQNQLEAPLIDSCLQLGEKLAGDRREFAHLVAQCEHSLKHESKESVVATTLITVSAVVTSAMVSGAAVASAVCHHITTTRWLYSTTSKTSCVLWRAELTHILTLFLDEALKYLKSTVHHFISTRGRAAKATATAEVAANKAATVVAANKAATVVAANKGAATVVAATVATTGASDCTANILSSTL